MKTQLQLPTAANSLTPGTPVALRGDTPPEITHAVGGWSLAVMKDGDLILTRGYGYADPEHDEPVQPDSFFHIASLSKAITVRVAAV